MKKISGLFLSLIISLLFITACSEKIVTLDGYLISANEFDYDNGNLYIKVNNDTKTYSFINKLSFIEGVIF